MSFTDDEHENEVLAEISIKYRNRDQPITLICSRIQFRYENEGNFKFRDRYNNNVKDRKSNENFDVSDEEYFTCEETDNVFENGKKLKLTEGPIKSLGKQELPFASHSSHTRKKSQDSSKRKNQRPFENEFKLPNLNADVQKFKTEMNSKFGIQPTVTEILSSDTEFSSSKSDSDLEFYQNCIDDADIIEYEKEYNNYLNSENFSYIYSHKDIQKSKHDFKIINSNISENGIETCSLISDILYEDIKIFDKNDESKAEYIDSEILKNDVTFSEAEYSENLTKRYDDDEEEDLYETTELFKFLNANGHCDQSRINVLLGFNNKRSNKSTKNVTEDEFDQLLNGDIVSRDSEGNDTNLNKLNKNMSLVNPHNGLGKKLWRALTVLGYKYEFPSDFLTNGTVENVILGGYKEKKIRRANRHLYLQSKEDITPNGTKLENENQPTNELDKQSDDTNIIQFGSPKISENIEENSIFPSKKPFQNRRNKKRTKQALQSMGGDESIRKYWFNRYKLFSKFNDGIKLDAESWYSVTPEKIAEYIANRCQCDLIVDAFCGAGGNTIQFAFTCERGIDIDPTKIALAKNNAAVYGVEDRIEFIVGDFFQIAPTLKADVVFLSPPWGGPQYLEEEVHLSNLLEEFGGGVHLFEVASKITENIVYYLPRNININQLLELSLVDDGLELEQNISTNRLRALVAYFGYLRQYGTNETV